jgi:uncharacterized membrane protein YagU involved in acid resistance
MTAWQELSTKLQGSGGNGGESNGQARAEHQDRWEEAPAPAKLARKVLEGVFEHEVKPDQIGLLTNVTHWGYGISWGAAYGLIEATAPGRALLRGLLFGTAVWATSYLVLVPAGLYRPPWEYPPRELALDLSYHLAYGAGVAGAFAAVTPE